MTKYRDGTEPVVDGVIAECCAICRGKLVTRWFGVVAHGRSGYRARAFPLRVCLKCKVAVQVRALPRVSLHPTRGAARASTARTIADRSRRYEGASL